MTQGFVYSCIIYIYGGNIYMYIYMYIKHVYIITVNFLRGVFHTTLDSLKKLSDCKC